MGLFYSVWLSGQSISWIDQTDFLNRPTSRIDHKQKSEKWNKPPAVYSYMNRGKVRPKIMLANLQLLLMIECKVRFWSSTLLKRGWELINAYFDRLCNKLVRRLRLLLIGQVRSFHYKELILEYFGQFCKLTLYNLFIVLCIMLDAIGALHL